MKPFLKAASVLLWLALETASRAGAPFLYHSGEILPSPRSAAYGDYLAAAGGASPPLRIITGESPPLPAVKAADRIFRAVEALAGKEGFAVLAESFEPGSPGTSVIICWGERNSPAREIIARRGYNLPESPEGYIIRHFRDGPADVFMAAGNSPRAALYAAHSLVQLMKADEERVLIRAAEVFDYPAFRMRISANDENIPGGGVPLEAAELLSSLKLNGWAAGHSYHWPRDWRRMEEERAAAFIEAAEFGGTGTIDVFFQFHPFGRADDEDLERTINIHRTSEINASADIINRMLSAGARGVLVRADDFSELTPADSGIFGGKALAHSYFLNEIRARTREKHPGAKILFCPPYYTGGEIAPSPEKQDYFKVVKEAVPDDVIFLWTGPEVCSFIIDEADIGRFRAFAGGNIMLWDNTVFRCRSPFGYYYDYAYYFLHQFETEYPPRSPGLLRGIRFNFGHDGTEISKIANINIADFAWNPEHYTPGDSIRKAVEAVAGKDAAPAVLEFGRLMRNSFDLQHSPARLLTLDEPFPPEKFTELLQEIREKSPNRKLADELEERYGWQSENISLLRALYTGFREAEEEALSVFDFSSRRARASSRGKWSVSRGRAHAEFSFPFETPSFPGAYGALSIRSTVPESGTGKYYLVFISDDDYNEQRTAGLWEGYLFRQLLVNGEVAWERDIAAERKIAFQVVDISGYVSAGERMDITIRGYGAEGVYNLGAQMAFSPVLLVDFVPGKTPETVGNGL